MTYMNGLGVARVVNNHLEPKRIQSTGILKKLFRPKYRYAAKITSKDKKTRKKEQKCLKEFCLRRGVIYR